MRGPERGATFFNGGGAQAWTLYHVLAKARPDAGTGIFVCECLCINSDPYGRLTFAPSSRVPVSVLRGSVRVG